LLLDRGAGDEGGKPSLFDLATVELPNPRTEGAGRLGRFAKLPLFSGVYPGDHVPVRHVVALDPVIQEHRFGELHRIAGEPDQRTSAIGAVRLQKRRQVLADRRRQVTGVSPACAESGVLALEHNHIDALSCEAHGRAQTGVTRSDDRYIAVHVIAQG
jgi:hypothetical protein